MGISLKVIIYFLTASMSLLPVTGNQRAPASITCLNKPETLKAIHGGSVTINCNYQGEKDIMVRQFCREDKNSQCTNLISTHKALNTKRDRYSLKDNKEQRVYTVTISTLTNADAGSYRCAAETQNHKPTTCLTLINLRILKWDDIPSRTKTFGIGDLVRIHCCYPKSHKNNEKFLCKGENPFSCKKLIHTTHEDRGVDQGRFGIRDDKEMNCFDVSIKNVNTADSGTYWCGSDKTWQYVEDMKTRLSADGGRTSTTTTSQKRTNPSPSEPHPAVIGGVVGCLVLLLLLGVVLLLVRHKLPRVHVCCAADGSSDHRTNAGNNTEGNNGDHNYEEIQIRNQQASSGGAVSSVYATVNPSADQLHYASVNFQNDSLSVPDTNKNGSSVCDRPPAAEQTLYSTVTRPGEA